MGLLSVVEYAALKRIHPNTVQVMLRDGRLKGEKVGKSWRIPEGAVIGGVEVVSVTKVESPIPVTAPEDAEMIALKKKRERLILEKEVKQLGAELADIVSEEEIKAFHDKEAALLTKEDELNQQAAKLSSSIANAQDQATQSDLIRQSLREWWSSIVTSLNDISDLLVELKAGEKSDGWLNPQQVKERWDEIIVKLAPFSKVPDLPEDFTHTKKAGSKKVKKDTQFSD